MCKEVNNYADVRNSNFGRSGNRLLGSRHGRQGTERRAKGAWQYHWLRDNCSHGGSFHSIAYLPDILAGDDEPTYDDDERPGDGAGTGGIYLSGADRQKVRDDAKNGYDAEEDETAEYGAERV